MKKFFSIVLSFVMLMGFVCLGASCKEETPDEVSSPVVEYERIELTTTNYKQYLSFDCTVTDCIADYIGSDSVENRKYNLSCIVNVKLKNTSNCHFVGKMNNFCASVAFSFSKTDWQIVASTSHYITIGYDGEGEVSIPLYREDSYFMNFPRVSALDITVTTITGFVLVPKTN